MQTRDTARVNLGLVPYEIEIARINLSGLEPQKIENISFYTSKIDRVVSIMFVIAKLIPKILYILFFLKVLLNVDAKKFTCCSRFTSERSWTGVPAD
jgi:hypothetical protein